MDGTLADLSSAYAAVEESLFGVADEEAKHPAPEAREQEQQADVAGAAPETEEVRPDDERPARRRIRRTGHRDRVWKAIEATPNFWVTLKPLETGAVERLYKLTGELNWEVFFITQRPATVGGTVQWQTHKWLVEQGLDFITYQRGEVHLDDHLFARREVRWDGQRVRFNIADLQAMQDVVVPLEAAAGNGRRRARAGEPASEL